MTVSKFSHADIVLMANMNVQQLEKVVCGKSVAGVMNFRRELQKGLAAYSSWHRKSGSGTRFDHVEAKMIWVCRQIEQWARRAYFKAMLPKVISAHPYMALSKKQQAKQYLLGKWEKFMKTQNY